MLGLLDLPAECIIQILLLLAPREIAKCRLISRALWTTINDSAALQYILEVECLGFVPLKNTSGGLSLGEMVLAVKEKRRMMCSDNAGDSDVIVLPDIYDQATLDYLDANVYSRGVLVLKGRDDENLLGIYQLSSRNRNLESTHYVLRSLPTHKRLAIEPTFDLLVLFHGTSDTATFHLRSLRTGLPHPNAALPTVTHVDDDDTQTRPESFVHDIRILGYRIGYTKGHQYYNSRTATVWDWVSGQTIASTPIDGYYSTFLSEDVFIAGDNAEFTLYTCSGTSPGGEARAIATFKLPTRRGSKLSHVQVLDIRPPSLWHNELAVSSHPLIYDSHPTPPYLCLDITPELGDVGLNRVLSINCSNLLAIASTLDARSDSDENSVPWSEWKSTARWVGPAYHDINSRYGPTVFGHLALYMHPDDQLQSWRVEVYDLRMDPMRSTSSSPTGKTSHLPQDQWITSVFNSPSEPLSSPSSVKSFAIPFDTIPWKAYSTHRLVNLMIDDEHIVIAEPRTSDGRSRLHIYPW